MHKTIVAQILEIALFFIELKRILVIKGSGDKD
jgi:hypothetical protein